MFADALWHFARRLHGDFVRWTAAQHMRQLLRRHISGNDECVEQLLRQIETLRAREGVCDADADDVQAYYAFLEPFLKAANAKELQDFDECAKELLAGRCEDKRRFAGDVGSVFRTASGMRVGISSANASDNWSNSKLSGGVTVNMSICFSALPAGVAPVTATLRLVPGEVKIALSVTHTMAHGGEMATERVEFTRNNNMTGFSFARMCCVLCFVSI